MKVAEIVRAEGAQLVKLPEGFQLEGDIVSIRRQGKAIVLEPVKPATWPPGFFEQIHIDDPAFARPPRGKCHRLQDWIELPPLLHTARTSLIRRDAGERLALAGRGSTITMRIAILGNLSCEVSRMVTVFNGSELGFDEQAARESRGRYSNLKAA